MIEPLHQLGEVGERACQAIHLVNDDAVHPAGIDVGQKPLDRRTLQRPARDPAVVVAILKEHPALVLLAGDIGGAGFILRVERVELLIEAFLRRLPRVDRAADF